MRRTTVVRAVLTPFVILALIGGLYWLMLHGFLTLAVWLVAAAIVALLVGTVWEWRRGHPRLGVLLLIGALITGGTVGTYGYNLNHKLSQVARASDGDLNYGPSRPKQEPNKALNIVLMGGDSRSASDTSNMQKAITTGAWKPGAYRSDTIMVLHIPANRKSAYVVSIPRDSYVPIYDAKGARHGSNKINYSFGEYGPFGTLRTVEDLTNLRMNHMAVIDFAGFRDLTTAIGGVNVYVPQTVYDYKQDQTWTKGWHHIEGDLALKYVRQRHGLANGDFDRVTRQQNFLRAVMDKVLADGTIGNPVKLLNTLDAITKHLVVDSSWSNSDLRNLALSLRNLHADKVKFVTIPLDHFEDIPGVGDSNIIAAQQTRELFKAVGKDTLGKYLKAHPEDELGSQTDVS